MIITGTPFSKKNQVQSAKRPVKGGVLLKELRVREKLSQDAFAGRIQETQANISRMENGKKTITKSVAKRIAEQFNVDYQIFLN
ncbi:MAG: helix-turn-helix transcriptional regulator [Proteobacteria bacterium]|nr:helix-turn-helix transcriptional regulator [Pseudomonadota bacterium]